MTSLPRVAGVSRCEVVPEQVLSRCEMVHEQGASLAAAAARIPPPPVPGREAPLPAGWAEAVAPGTGATYFYNASTGARSAPHHLGMRGRC